MNCLPFLYPVQGAICEDYTSLFMYFCMCIHLCICTFVYLSQQYIHVLFLLHGSGHTGIAVGPSVKIEPTKWLGPASLWVGKPLGGIAATGELL